MKRAYQSGAQKIKEKKKKSLDDDKSSKRLNIWLNSGSSTQSKHNDSSNTGMLELFYIIFINAIRTLHLYPGFILEVFLTI